MANRIVRLGIAGDLMLGCGVLTHMVNQGVEFPFARVKNELRRFDLFFANFECTLSSSHKPPHPSKILLHTKPNAILGMKSSGINIVSLANNHTFDYGPEGFSETKKILRENGIATVGGGLTLKEASQPEIILCNGLRLSFLGYCSKETGCRHFASLTDFGVADVKTDDICNDIHKAKCLSDIVIVSLHWGEEFRDYPTPHNIEIAHALIDHGAAIVLGHHAHVYQGYESYNGGLIIYDLGSFIFGDIIQNGYTFRLKRRKHREGIIADCILDDSGILDFNFESVFINRSFQATLPPSGGNERILDRFYRQSENIKANNYISFFKKYLLKAKLFSLITVTVNFAQKAILPYNWYRLVCKAIRNTRPF